MTEKTAIVADPISSDGSEESWILLDEMDAAMNEDVHSPHRPTDDDEVDQSASIHTITESNPIEEVADNVKSAEKADTANEESVYSDLIPTVIETAEDATNSEAISACPSEDEEVDETAHLRR